MGIIGIGIGVVILCGLFCWAFPGVPQKLHVILNGKANKYIEDYAKTPEGAREIYKEAIEKAREIYTKNADIHKEAAGTLAAEEKRLADLSAEFTSLSKRCEALVSKGKMEEAKVLAQKRADVEAEMEISKKDVEDYRQAAADAKVIAENTEKALRKLEQDAKLNVRRLESNKQKEEMYDRLDESRKDDTIKKLLADVDLGLDESTRRAVGAQAVHENKLETKATKAIAVADSVETDAYLEELKKKYEVE